MSAAAVAEPDASLVLNKERMAFRTDAGIGLRANLGLLVLRTDQTIEDEFRFALPPGGVALYEARLYNDAEITPEKLARMYDEVPATVGLLPQRSEEHTSELQSLMRISYAVFCLKKKTVQIQHN